MAPERGVKDFSSEPHRHRDATGSQAPLNRLILKSLVPPFSRKREHIPQNIYFRAPPFLLLSVTKGVN